MKKLYLMTALAVILSAQNANAAGYQLNEFSAAGLGRSFAGMGVVGDDFSALGFNPAGMTAQKRSGVQLGLAMTEIAAKAKSKYGTDKMDYFVPQPSALGQYNLNDKWFFGLGVYVPYGLSTKYKHDSHVAQSASGVRKSELEVVDTNFSTAYRFDMGLSLGASAILRYIKGQLTSSVNTPNPQTGDILNLGYNDYRVKGWSQSWQLGAMYEFNENTRIGLSYRFKSTQHTHGKQYLYMNELGQMLTQLGSFNRYDTMADPELPASWILSGYHKWNDKWASAATVKYIQWHRFYTFPAKSNSPLKNGNYDSDYRWKDSWTFALGQEYFANENWTFRAGTAWDQAPTANNNFRTNRIPDVDRIWFSLGASYTNGNHQVDLGYAFLTMMHGRVRDSYNGDMEAKYHNHSNMFALGYQYKF